MREERREDAYAAKLTRVNLDIALVDEQGLLDNDKFIAELLKNPHDTPDGEKFRRQWQQFSNLLSDGKQLQIIKLNPQFLVDKATRSWLMRELSFEHTRFTRCDFSDCGLEDVQFHSCYLQDCSSTRGSWERFGMVKTALNECGFVGLGWGEATLLDTRISDTTLQDVSLTRSVFRGLAIWDSVIKKCVLKDLHWEGRAAGGKRQTVLNHVEFESTTFENCRLKDMEWHDVQLNHSFLRGNEAKSLRSEELRARDSEICDNKFTNSMTRRSQLSNCKVLGNTAPQQPVDLLEFELAARSEPQRVSGLEPLSF